MSFRNETGLNGFNDQFKTHREQAKEQPKTCEFSAPFGCPALSPPPLPADTLKT